MNARLFDPQWTTDKKSLIAYLDGVCINLTTLGSRSRKRRSSAQNSFETCAKAIMLDVFRAHETDPELEVGISMGTTALQQKSKSRYGASFISSRTFIDAMRALQEAGLIVLSTPHWDDPEKKSSRVARYMATPVLLQGFANTEASIVHLRRRENAEGIRLKDNNKRLVEYGDNAFANNARQRLRVINDMLESHWADLAISDDRLSREIKQVSGMRDEEATQSFDFAARTVHRVFNNSDWQQGGRFYGAWWISCPSYLRQHIVIDGKRTVEVDYSGLHAAMLYADVGLPIPTDPYQRCLKREGGAVERQLVKRTFNALLNANSVKGINEIEGYSSEITERPWDDFKHYIVNSYPEFQQYFGSGVGLKLQRKDSDLAEAVMLRFAAMNYACLPVHDSFIVHHGLERELIDIMLEEFQAKLGAAITVGVDAGIELVKYFSALPVEMPENWLLEFKGYEARLQKFWERHDLV